MKLTKHHGLANDFLVMIDIDNALSITPQLARAVCDRRIGVGADGLIRVSGGTKGADLTMELLNSDGSFAEMSGNGMRCLAQAVAMSGHEPGASYTVATAGGVREVRHGVGNRPGESWVSVDMGPTSPSAISPDSLSHAALSVSTAPMKTATIDIANPHVVMLVDNVESVDVGLLGPSYEEQFPAGANVEWVEPVDRGAIKMRVWERGAGITQACGTGACASARAAHDWGLVDDTVAVAMPGGRVEVHLGDVVTLTGPAAYIATIDIDPDLLGL